jgi:hypothetical protein
MKRLENIDAFNGTSFHGHVVHASVNDLVKICGEPYRGDVEDKVQYEWTMQTSKGLPFTIYDWKEYRNYSNDEIIGWHIGGHRGIDAIAGMKELEDALESAMFEDDLSEQEQIEAILEEANGWGLRQEVKMSAEKLMCLAPDMDPIDAYTHGFNEWIK